MILQALASYYDELLQKGKIAAPGWDSSFRVSYGLEINDTGDLVDVIDLREQITNEKKNVLLPRKMCVPAHVGRSSGIAANFLCDNSTYLLGADNKGKPDRSRSCFQECARFHHQLLDSLSSPAAHAVCSFFDQWNPASAALHPLLADKWDDIAQTANLVFFYDYSSGRHPVTEDPELKEAWQRYYQSNNSNAPTQQCLITGKKAPLALTHPLIKGVRGAQSSGASLVSFNAPAFCSYGKTQGLNAPISEEAAFSYTSALNYLLGHPEHYRFWGNTTVLCWAQNASDSCVSFSLQALCGFSAETGIDENDVLRALDLLSQGKRCAWLEEELLPDQHIFFLGLSPNAARLSVRFFFYDNLRHFSENILRFEKEQEIVRPKYDPCRILSIPALAMETVNKKSSSPTPSSQLIGDLFRCVLTGSRYPATLLNGITLRIRAEQGNNKITRGRAAILKAYYTRNTHPLCPKEVLTMSLNEQSNYTPYVLGRLFSVLEAVQRDASHKSSQSGIPSRDKQTEDKNNNREVTTTIKDRYFNSACINPAMVFPTLIRLSQNHLKAMTTGPDGEKNKRKAISYSKQIEALIDRLPENFPVHLSLPEQGAFEIGYYHQTQRFFKKKTTENRES